MKVYSREVVEVLQQPLYQFLKHIGLGTEGSYNVSVSLSSFLVTPVILLTQSISGTQSLLCVCHINVRHTITILMCRSTPCPNVKQGDEWGDPSKCENGDNCGYCHTRTEQQFHLEVSLSLFS